MVIDNVTFQDYFDTFSKEVEEKHYKKMDYEKWRHIKSYLPSCDFVEITKGDLIKLSFSSHSNRVLRTLYFGEVDGSFGQYLNEHILLDKDKKDTSYKAFVSSSDNDNLNAMVKKALKKANLSAGLAGGSISGYGVGTIPGPPGIFNSLTNGPYLDKTIYSNGDSLTYNDKLNTKSIYFSDHSLPSIAYVESYNDKMDHLKKQFDELEAKVATVVIDDTKNSDNTKRKEKNMINFNFDFGPVDSDAIRMSPYGLAVRNTDGKYVSYDAVNEKVIDVDVFNFDGSKFMYKMPVALNDVAVGDIIIHAHKPMFVVDVSLTNKLGVIDIFNGESKTVLPATNMFGFNFVTKVVSFIDMGTPTQDNPFGNIMPFLLMNSDANKDKDSFLMAMMMTQNASGINMFQNPLMMMMLMDDKNGKTDDIFKLMMMSQMMSKSNLINQEKRTYDPDESVG